MGGIQDPATVAPGVQSLTNLTGTLPDTDEDPIGKQGLIIMRLYATLRINSTDANLFVEAAFGFIMVDGDALAALAVPDPDIDPEADWMYWDNRAFLPASDSQQYMTLDIKARRRFRGNDENALLVIRNHDAAQSLEFALAFRMLLALL